MNRRDFIRRTVPVTAFPFFLGGFTIKAYGRSPFLETLIASATETDRVFVLIQLNGGNDGLNTVIPLDQYSALANARSNILIDQSKVLPLASATGLHPSMTGLQSLYTEGKLTVVQSVGYPNPSFSHFRATDIWLTAADSDQTLDTGWMGRYLGREFPGFPSGYPNTGMPDPLAIQVGSVVTTGLEGPVENMGMAITSPNSFYQLVSGGYDTAPDTPAGHELTFIREVVQETQAYATSIKGAAGKGSNKSTLYPTAGQNSLADQLKIVAQLVSGGLKTRIYVVNLGGFDNHAAEVDATLGTDKGIHATLLGKLSDAVAAFQDDLHLLGVEDRVIGMTFSEFGRRIKSNASLGTDHGAAAPLFVFGSNINAGVIGANPTLPTNATVNDNVAMQYDFRSVYASILRDWFGVPEPELESVLMKDFQSVPIVKPSALGVGPGSIVPSVLGLYQNFPNPFNPSTRIPFSTNGNHVQIEVFDSIGRQIRLLVDGTYSNGHHEVSFDGTGLPSGVYYYRLKSGSFQQMKSMILLK